MGSSTDISSPMSEFTERARRKPGAAGTPVRLADGQDWLLATPTFRPGRGPLTSPAIDGPLDRIFDRLALGDGVPVPDAWEVAMALLRANYDLGVEELAELLSITPGAEGAALLGAVLDALFGPESPARSYSDWVRASLLANGLDAVAIPAPDLPNVLAVLVATRRAVPAARFVEACRAASTRSALETLV